MPKKSTKKINEYIPTAVIVIACIALASAVIHIISKFSRQFADFFNENISSVIRAALAHITNLIPFSIAEGIFMFLPVIFFVLIFIGAKKSCETWKSVIRYTSSILSVVLVLYIFFVWGFATGYNGSFLEDKLGIEKKDVSAEELEETAMYLLEKTNNSLSGICFTEEGYSVMPYSRAKMNDKLLEAYYRVSEKYSFVPHLSSRLKPVILSEPMTYTHISGMYSYFTGEANLNVNFPDYTIPYTAAHELAHQRGIAREDEANFMAFLVCMESDDPYIKYSGYLNLYEYVASALYSADTEKYYNVISDMDGAVRGELRSYNKFFEKYEHSVISDVSGTINDTYLKLQGTSGSKSYGQVVDLAVAYLKNAVGN